MIHLISAKAAAQQFKCRCATFKVQCAKARFFLHYVTKAAKPSAKAAAQRSKFKVQCAGGAVCRVLGLAIWLQLRGTPRPYIGAGKATCCWRYC